MSGDKGALSGDKGAKSGNKGAKSVINAQKLADLAGFKKTGIVKYLYKLFLLGNE